MDIRIYHRLGQRNPKPRFLLASFWIKGYSVIQCCADRPVCEEAVCPSARVEGSAAEVFDAK
jgi:hypothetical protein